MFVHFGEPSFACFPIVSAIYDPSFNLLERTLVQPRDHVVTRHHATWEEMLTHPITRSINFESIWVLDMCKYMHEHESVWFEPLCNSSKKSLPVSHMFKHLDCNYTIKLSIIRCSLKIIHVTSNYFQVCNSSLLCLVKDMLSLRTGVGNWHNLAVGIVFCHPER